MDAAISIVPLATSVAAFAMLRAVSATATIERLVSSTDAAVSAIDVAKPAVPCAISSIDAASSLIDDATASPDDVIDPACSAVRRSDCVISVAVTTDASSNVACDSLPRTMPAKLSARLFALSATRLASEWNAAPFDWPFDLPNGFRIARSLMGIVSRSSCEERHCAGLERSAFVCNAKQL
ncbi:MAG TPA: hypothetical protein VHZ95_09025 [Polyangiales bacterium]|nr:hypothetical protein [Polyangiales bacterium]